MSCRVNAGPGNTIEATAECLDRSNTPCPVHLFTFQKAAGDSLRVEDDTQWPGMSRQAMGTILPPCQGCFRRFGIVMPDGSLLEIYAFPTPVARVADRCADRAVAGIAAAAVLCEIGHQHVHRRTVGGVDQRIAPRGGTSPGRHASVGRRNERVVEFRPSFSPICPTARPSLPACTGIRKISRRVSCASAAKAAMVPIFSISPESCKCFYARNKNGAETASGAIHYLPARSAVDDAVRAITDR